ncbi:hypothetical protein [Burkholderia sp. LMG 21824]|uniref:restriction endonuclease-related protein n=1 Tax=Burkholderia sp. LMG 21824 TaxID=3158172 RepID=UPI003C2D41BF
MTVEYSTVTKMSSLARALQKEQEWSGSMDELVRKATALCVAHAIRENVYLPEITKGLVKSYRSYRILSPADGKKFGWHHLVQLIAARFLVSLGWKRGEVGTYLQRYSAEFLALHLETIDDVLRTSEASDLVIEKIDFENAAVATQLLAAGIVQQYQSIRDGAVLVHDATMSPLLSQAMLLLASFYVSAGKEDTVGSVHALLDRCRHPLSADAWQLEVYSNPAFPYHGIRLLDPDRRIPTLDCAELARQSYSELDLREKLAFDALRAISEQFVGRQEAAYSELRRSVTEHPVTTTQELQKFTRTLNLQLAGPFLSSCYELVQPHHLVGGKMYLCECCGVPMRRSSAISTLVACPTPQCKQFDKPLENLSYVWTSDTVVAKSHILMYWIGPGIDECTLYRKANVHQLGPRMYPALDACDLSLQDDSVGIDVKSYSSPFILADKLNKGNLGLAPFNRRIVAINDQAISRFRGYLDIVRARYSGSLTLEFMSVGQLLAKMENSF